jgi:UDP-glucuronate decarboxylase
MNSGDDVTGPVNIGNPNEFPVLHLAKAVIELTGSRSRIVHRALPQDDPRQRSPDIAMASEILDWSPHTQLRDGLMQTIEYFEALLSDDEILPFINHGQRW